MSMLSFESFIKSAFFEVKITPPTAQRRHENPTSIITQRHKQHRRHLAGQLAQHASNMDDTSSVGSTDMSRPLPMTFDKWRDACLNNPSSKEKVRLQATEIFSFLGKHVEHLTPDNVIMKTKSSCNMALAQLIQELQPALSDTPYASRICALYCIWGAIEGCSVLSFEIKNLLGNFFLGQCGPLEPEGDDEDDSDELVRDAAVMCLSALVRAQTEESSQDGPIEQTVQLHLDLARKGVERRCASPEMDEMEYDHGYDFPSSKNDIRGGLSTLPRSRRSLCFDLVRAVIDGLTLLSGDFLRVPSTKSDLASFALFAAACLHGESDPRCLMQLLRMLHALQRNLLRFFQEAYTVSSVQFPIVSIFDAVAPYYPIQFTPPPNDVHGISKQGLHEALMAVLCFTGYDSFAAGGDTMLNLTAGIFVERLIPLENDDGTSPSSVEDKLDAMGDLATLLLRDSSSLCNQMSEHTVKELSIALFTTHAEAASGAMAGGKNGRKNKALADACRNLVSKVASALEVSSQSALWDIFVRDTVRVWSPLLSTSPQSVQGRASVAYLACLSASGGPWTLNLCLQSCLPPLIDILTNEKDDEEKVVAAAYGTGAFFSSIQVAVSRGMKEGVELHPNPLEPFGANAFRALYDLMGIHTVTKGDSSPTKVKEVQPSLRIAAIGAVDSVLTATPASLLEDGDIDKVCALFDTLESLVEDADNMTIDESISTDNEIALRTAAARTIGYILGKSFEDGRSDVPAEASGLHSLLGESEKVRRHLRENIYPSLLSSSKRLLPSSNETESLRFDWMALACCCEMNQNAANQVLSVLVNSLNDALKQKDFANQLLEVHLAMWLCFVIQHGGAQAITAFRSLSAPNASPMDLITSICSISAASEEKAKVSASPEKTRATRVSTLMLPSTSEDREEINAMVERAYGILPYLIPACKYPFSQPQMAKLLDHVSHVLPPLNDWQSGQLCIALPVLSVALSQGASKLSGQDEKTNVFDTLQSIAPYLTDCALNPDFDARARSAGASCLYHIITKLQNPDMTECLSRTALRDSVMPCVLESIKSAKVAPTAGSAASTLCEALGVAAVLGSAAAVRGRSSSEIADKVALFLIQLSCDGKAQPPFVHDEHIIDFAVLDEALLRFASASAFGSMVSTEDGSPLWRQRLMHLATNHLLHSPDANAGRLLLSPSSPSPAELGRLLISCYVVASSGITALGETALSAMGDTIMFVLSEIYAEETVTNATINALGSQIFSVKELALAAVVKLMTVAPGTMANHNSILVPILLRAYTDEYVDNPMLVSPCKMLALQGLFNATHYFKPLKKSLLSIKPAVVSVLSSAAENPSIALRQTAVDARNAWFLLE